MNAYYRVNSPHNDLAQAATALRKQTYLLWQDYLPDIYDDIDLVAENFSSLTGESDFRIGKIIMALHRLNELPKLKALQETYYHLDLNRFIAIDDVLSKLGIEIPQDQLAYLDEEITKYLTPTKPNQTLPSVANLRRKLNALIAPLNDVIDVNKDADKPRDTYDSYPVSNGAAGIYAEYDKATAEIIDHHIHTVASKLKITRAQAMAKLLTGEIDPLETARVVLYLYRAKDIQDAPAFLRDAGWLDTTTSSKLAQHPEVTVDLEEAGERESGKYVTPPDIGAVVEGRDGTCRWPGCTRPASQCQKDHRIDFAKGGPTAASNLASLCQHHHNIKTDGRANYIMDPHTGDIYWLFEDGHWEIDEASGPLSPKSRHWVQTVEQAIKAKRKDAFSRAAKVMGVILCAIG